MCFEKVHERIMGYFTEYTDFCVRTLQRKTWDGALRNYAFPQGSFEDLLFLW